MFCLAPLMCPLALLDGLQGPADVYFGPADVPARVQRQTVTSGNCISHVLLSLIAELVADHHC